MRTTLNFILKLLFSVLNFLIILNYMPVIFVLFKFFFREIFLRKFVDKNSSNFREINLHPVTDRIEPILTEKFTACEREWPRVTASDRGKLWKPLINFLRMREWSNFTRNAIDQLQIVLTNLKSKLGKFLCPKMVNGFFDHPKWKSP